jgi:hypothetical protein
MEYIVRELKLPDDFPYSIYEYYNDRPQIAISVGYLDLLTPSVIKRLQAAMKDFPGWEIVYSVAVSDVDWPAMGLYIRQDIIIDGLQRQYFPPEYQGIRYEGSRPGDHRDSIAYTPPLTHPEFEPLCDEVRLTLEAVAQREGLGPERSFWIYEDYPGNHNVVLIAKAELMQPDVIADLQRVLDRFPAWILVITPDHIPTRGEPVTFIEVRHDEIVDGLDRRYLPPAYSAIRYPGARRTGDEG